LIKLYNDLEVRASILTKVGIHPMANTYKLVSHEVIFIATSIKDKTTLYQLGKRF